MSKIGANSDERKCFIPFASPLPQIPGQVERSFIQWISMELTCITWVHVWSRFPYLILADLARCPTVPQMGTLSLTVNQLQKWILEFWSGWANSKNPHSSHHCLPSCFIVGIAKEHKWLWYWYEVQNAVHPALKGGWKTVWWGLKEEHSPHNCQERLLKFEIGLRRRMFWGKGSRRNIFLMLK